MTAPMPPPPPSPPLAVPQSPPPLAVPQTPPPLAVPQTPWTPRVLQHLGVGVALASLLAGLASHVSTSMSAYGRLIYTVDDAYIHLAMARSIAEHGVYGVVPTDFSSASSSPLWTLLLAGLMVITPSSLDEWVSLLAGTLAAAAVLWMIVRTAVRAWAQSAATWGMGASQRPVTAGHGQALALALLAAVLPWALGQMQLVLCGMEHGLHMAVTMAFGLATAGVVARVGPVWPMLLLGSLMTVVRFESVAPVLVAAGLLGWQRRWKLAVGLLAGAFGAIALQGLWSLAHGEAFLPNSVLVKIAIHAPGGGAAVPTPVALEPLVAVPLAQGVPAPPPPPPPGTLDKLLAFPLTVMTRWGGNLGHSFGVLLALVTTLLLAAFRLGQGRLALYDRVLVLLVVATVGAQTAMGGSPAAMERYQSYLAGFTLLSLARLGGSLWLAPWHGLSRQLATWAPVVILPLAFLPALVREARLPSGQMHLVYIGHWLPGEFLAEAVPDGAVVIEDLGAIAWLRPKPLIDIFGLATHEVAQRVVKKSSDARFLEDVARRKGAVAALVRPSALPLEPLHALGSRPKSWIPVGFIGLKAKRTQWNQALVLFAIDPARVPALTESLRKFRARLPDDLVVVLATDPEAAGFPGTRP